MYHTRSHCNPISFVRFAFTKYLFAISAVVLLAIIPAATPDAHAQDDATWDTIFGAAGLNNSVNALAIDSNGNLYAAGTFTTAGGQPASHIARWDGATWTTLGSGISGVVHALAIDASNAVYAAGLFTSAGDATVANIAKWDGTSWSPLGAGLDATVFALAVDASGDVYAGGDFTTAGGSSASRIAVWDGTSWSALGSGMNNSVLALALDDGGNLYAGGSFSDGGGNSNADRIAMWNGSAWEALGDTGANLLIRAVAVHGSSVYVGGDFAHIDGVLANKIARWDGTSWSAINTSGISKVYALAAVPGGDLYVGGYFVEIDGLSAQYVAAYDGTNWSALGSGVDNMVKALAAGSSSVFVGGDFATAGAQASPHIARWALAASSEPSESLEPAPAPIQPVASAATVTPGQSFSVAVEVGADTTAVSNLFGTGFALHFDPALFQASSAAAGAFLDDGDLIFDETIDNTTGTVYVSITRKRGATGVNGYGAVARINFTTIHNGAPQSATFSLSDVLAVDPDGTEVSLVAQSGGVDINTLAVWPGDTDNDGDADISDVLSVGIHFGLSGPARASDSFTWEAQTAQAWTPAAAMYADATGDGLISQNDILPIGVNFGLNRNTSPDTPALRAIAQPLASLRIHTLPVGERFSATLSLEAAGHAVDALLGYAAELSLPPSLKVVASHPGVLLENGDLLSLDQAAGNRFYVAHTRKRTASPVTGSGPLLELSFEVIAPMEGGSTLTLDALSLGTPGGTVAAGQNTPVELTSPLAVPNESETPVEFALRGSYPNPFSSQAAIAFDLPEEARVTVTIYDVLGREVGRIDAGILAAGANQHVQIDGAGLASGSYVYRLQAEMTQGSAIATGHFVLAR